jgi:hypothetical protein
MPAFGQAIFFSTDKIPTALPPANGLAEMHFPSLGGHFGNVGGIAASLRCDRQF